MLSLPDDEEEWWGWGAPLPNSAALAIALFWWGWARCTHEPTGCELEKMAVSTQEDVLGCAVPDCAYADDPAAAAPQSVCFQDPRHKMHALCAYEWVAACGERPASCPLCRDTACMAFIQQIVRKGLASRTEGGGTTLMPREAHDDDIVVASDVLPVQTTVDTLRSAYVLSMHLSALHRQKLGEVEKLVGALRGVVHSTLGFAVDAYIAATQRITVKQEQDRVHAIMPLLTMRVAGVETAFDRCHVALAHIGGGGEDDSDDESDDASTSDEEDMVLLPIG
jgi:hypothetical protein